ncbi:MULTISPECIES: hypothetical protein [Bradyrhizobium]|jgi:hypothetical protein|uniref:Uncharacterized protein n=1 Tax=Bradyrhizobium elkanii TaxID=29448 RepID=A0A8I2C4X4_BRAEL|nr:MULTISPECIES: hypothetical protein [Bradyrhizobium]MBP1293527.1 hypothetical protein [Bradyrhizobium elkanii]MCP1925888.1 hypothetical protein [Bradyrhizobium elkanii]MCS3476620.1 hypothetical protein [Bradyrhizobium elkanii]MCS3566454.1 hypothetical protein [Bradyrhizobium elkanii]MCS3583358.1 hypothetical protein [Bradyrhizobium elkanii]
MTDFANHQYTERIFCRDMANGEFWIDEGGWRTLDALGRSSARHLANNISPDLRASAIEHRYDRGTNSLS